MKNSLSVIVPFFNEEKTIEDSLRRLLKVKVIKRAFGGGASKLIDIDSFAENLSHSYTHANSDGEAGLSVKNSSMMQMVEFTYQMAQMKQKKSESAGDMLQEFLTKAYYFAQKRGQIYNFGPFGKLY